MLLEYENCLLNIPTETYENLTDSSIVTLNIVASNDPMHVDLNYKTISFCFNKEFWPCSILKNLKIVNYKDVTHNYKYVFEIWTV